MSNLKMLPQLFAEPWAMDKDRLLALFSRLDSGVSLNQVTVRIEPPGSERSYKLQDGVARIPIHGVILKSEEWAEALTWYGIQATSTTKAGRDLRAALADNEVSSVVLDVDSPGGTVSGVQELADLVAAPRSKSIRAEVSDLAASAGYWIASQADSVSANPSAAIGSIGVYTVVYDSSKRFEEAGIKTHVVSSHELKGTGVTGSPVTEAQLADIKRNVLGYAELFETAVALGRKMSGDQVSAVATGQVWLAKEAKSLGLIDEVRSTQPAMMPVVSETIAPRVGAEESEMADKASPTVSAADNVEELKASLAKAQAERDAERAHIEALKDEQREAAIVRQASRIAPAAREKLLAFGKSMEPAEFEKWIVETLPVQTRPERESVSPEAGALQPGMSEAPNMEERSLCKMMGQTPQRLRDMCKVSDAVDYVNRDGMAVLKDGRTVDRSTLHKMLGLSGAAIAFLLCLALPSFAHAALSAARATECKGTGITKTYLMTASKSIYSGGLVMITSAGTAEAAAASASSHNVAGVAQESKTSGSSGSYYIKVSDGVICKFAGDTLEQADVGVTVFAQDDQTVDETQSTNEPVAGILVEYVSASVGWVYVSSLVNFGRVNVAQPITLTDVLTFSEAGTLGQPSNNTFEFDEAEDLTIDLSVSNVLTLSSDTSIAEVDFGALGATLKLANDETIVNDTNNEIQLGNGTEDISFGFATSNTVDLSSDTGVVVLDLAAVGTTVSLANGQTIVSDADGEIQFGDGTEDISLGFGTENTCLVTTDTGVVSWDFGAVGTTIVLANDQSIVSDEDNVIKLGDAEDIEFDFSVNNTLTLSSDSGVTKVDFVSMNIETDGTFQVLGSGATIGWTVAAAGNTACSTTCAGTGACVFGLDAGTHAVVLCSDATADSCVCAGPAS